MELHITTNICKWIVIGLLQAPRWIILFCTHCNFNINLVVTAVLQEVKLAV